MKPTRRHFFSQSVALAAGGLMTPYVFSASAAAGNQPQSKNDQFGIGAIGMRYQGSVITERARPYGPIVAIADVDRHVVTIRGIAERSRDIIAIRSGAEAHFQHLTAHG